MEYAAGLARTGDRIVSLIAAGLIALLLLYGGYSLWDTYMTYTAAFTSDDLMTYKPLSDGNVDSNPTLEELQEINPDVCAWITIDDTNIDYPVVQGETDMEYVNKDIYGDFALSGAIFLSSNNAFDFSDSYNLLFGHHMDNGAMFGNVVDFTDEDYFETHTTGTLYLPDATYSIYLFAVVEVDAYDLVVYNTGSSVGELMEYVQEIAVKSRSLEINEDDKIIGLSTCYDSTTNGRVVLYGKLIRL